MWSLRSRGSKRLEFYRENDPEALRKLLSKCLVGMTPYTFYVSYQFLDVHLTSFCDDHFFRDDLTLNLSSDAYILKKGRRTISVDTEIPDKRADLVKMLMMSEEIVSVDMTDVGQLTLNFRAEIQLIAPIDFSFPACEPSWVLLEQGRYRSDFGTFTDWYIGCDLDGPFGNLSEND